MNEQIAGGMVRRFRMAKLFDAEDPDHGPMFSADHPKLDDAAEKARILTFLDGGALVLRAAGTTEDLYDRSRGKRVPIVSMTDGEWIWASAHAYYLMNYDLALDPEFYEHIRRSGYVANEPDNETAAAAEAFLLSGQYE